MDDGVPIRSVSRTIAVLKLINRHRSIPLHRIVRSTGLSFPTVSRIVRTLAHEGLVEQEPVSRHYRPSAAVQELAIGYQPENRLVAIARPHLEKITNAHHWPVGISRRVGMNMVLQDSTHSRTTLTFDNYPAGYTFPLFNSASGLLCLAFTNIGSDEEVALGAPGGAVQARLRPDEEILLKIRKQGYALLAGDDNPGPSRTGGIAVPVFHGGEFVAALTLVYFASAISQREAAAQFAEPLKHEAALISRALDRA